MTIDSDPGFKIIAPEPPRSPEAAEFFRNHPEFTVSDSLTFLTDHYPDTSEWIVDSGVAVQALTGRREGYPSDIDIVSLSPDMETDFGHSDGIDPADRRYIDVKSIDHWLLGRGAGLADPSSLWPYIVALSLPRDIEGHSVRIMHPAIIAAGKSTMAKMTQRPKDTADLELLAVEPGQLQAATELLRGHDLERQFRLLQPHS
ncbi:MAG TPA: hypothetical protein VLG36_06020 [Candidatus Chromulinivoraceae bacterium]|nr:hypothetical protein [Candidatus Chromulinivoraceae bacterium]